MNEYLMQLLQKGGLLGQSLPTIMQGQTGLTNPQAYRNMGDMGEMNFPMSTQPGNKMIDGELWVRDRQLPSIKSQQNQQGNQQQNSNDDMLRQMLMMQQLRGGLLGGMR